MTVQTTNNTAVFDGNGVATVFPFGFPFKANGDIKLYSKDASGVVQPVLSGFTLTGAGSPNGGTVTMTAAPATGTKLVIAREMVIKQLIDLRNQGKFFPETHEEAFDILTMLIQQVSERVDRAVKVDISGDSSPDALIQGINNVAAAAQTSANSAAGSAAAAGNSATAASNSATNASASAAAAAASAAFAGDPWALQPIGVPIPVFDHIAGVVAPPTDREYRYIKLTASDAYNTGVLTGESVSGSAPLVVATAVVSLAGSPVNGRTVQLINTERRSLRAGASGTIEADAMQGHRHGYNAPVSGPFAGGAGSLQSGLTALTSGDPVTDGTNGTPRTSNETRAKNIGATYYMRIK